MSNPMSKAIRSAAKDQRQGIDREAPPKPLAAAQPKARKPAKHFRVRRNWRLNGLTMQPYTVHRSATQEHAIQMADKARRSWNRLANEIWIEQRMEDGSWVKVV